MILGTLVTISELPQLPNEEVAEDDVWRFFPTPPSGCYLSLPGVSGIRVGLGWEERPEEQRAEDEGEGQDRRSGQQLVGESTACVSSQGPSERPPRGGYFLEAPLSPPATAGRQERSPEPGNPFSS